MFLHVVEVRPLGGSALWLRFSDGAEGEVDLGPELEGPVFGPLRDPGVFAEVQLDPELRTVAWPNGADLAPEFLHGLVQQVAPPNVALQATSTRGEGSTPSTRITGGTPRAVQARA